MECCLCNTVLAILFVYLFSTSNGKLDLYSKSEANLFYLVIDGLDFIHVSDCSVYHFA